MTAITFTLDDAALKSALGKLPSRFRASQAAAHRASVPTAQAARSAKLGEACK